LSSIDGDSYPVLARNWFLELESSESQPCLAKDLYVGGSWARAKEIGKYFDHKWIISAGYGLISTDALVKPYDATFSSGHDNSIPDLHYVGLKEKNLAWWRALEHSKDNTAGVPGGVKGLIKEHNPELIVIVASKHYLRLIHSALEECLLTGLIDRQKLIVISSYKSPGIVGEQTVPVGGDLQGVFNCTMGTLSLCVANYLLDHCSDRSVEKFKELVASLPRIEKEKKEVIKLTDSEVLSEIEKIIEIHGEKAGSASKALSLLRNTYGLSCEQKRFGRLYKQFKQLEFVG
jgi:hypothetical protein